jgi:hypothetical protein
MNQPTEQEAIVRVLEVVFEHDMWDESRWAWAWPGIVYMLKKLDAGTTINRWKASSLLKDFDR